MKEYNEEFSEVLKRLTKEEKTSVCRQILKVIVDGRVNFPNNPDMNKAFAMLCPSRLKQLHTEFREYLDEKYINSFLKHWDIIDNRVLGGTINEIVSDALLVYDFIYSLVENGELVMSKDNIARNVGIPVVRVKKAIDFMESCKVIEVKKMDKVNSFCYKLVSQCGGYKKGKEILLNYKP